MGILGTAISNGAVTGVNVEYIGDLADVDTGLLTTATLKGILNPILQDSVNFVNAPDLAKARRMQVQETKKNSFSFYLWSMGYPLLFEVKQLVFVLLHRLTRNTRFLYFE